MELRSVVVFAAGMVLATGAAVAETPQSLIQRTVNSERAANQTDHSNWLYREEVKKPKDGVVQWVAATQYGSVRRVFERGGQRVPEENSARRCRSFFATRGRRRRR